MRAVLKWFGIVIGIMFGVFILLAVLATVFGGGRQRAQAPAAKATATPVGTSSRVPVATQTFAPEPHPREFKGAGTKVSPTFDLQPGLAVFQMAHHGKGEFSVKLLDAGGKGVDLARYEKSPFNWAAVVAVEKAQWWPDWGVTEPGAHVLRIDGDGDWSILLNQVSLGSLPEPPQTFKGRGNAMSPPFLLREGLVTFSLTHNGSSEFAVVLLSVPAIPGGNREVLLIKKGVFEGSTAVGVVGPGEAGVKSRIYVLEIRADGNWTVSISR